MKGLIRNYTIVDQDGKTFAVARTNDEAIMIADDAVEDNVLGSYWIFDTVITASHENNIFLKAAMGRSRLWH